MRLPIYLQREILRLHFYEPNQSNRLIARTVGVAANTVRALRSLATEQETTWNEIRELDDDAWEARLDTRNRSVAQRKEAPDWGWVHDQMQRADATLEQLWREWKAHHPKGIAYSQFTTGYRRYRKSLHVVMRRHHLPGDKLYVDFAGRTIEVKRRNGEPSIMAQVFVAVLGFSNFTYLQAVATQGTNDWIACHVGCFAALGGAPSWVVPDNLKAAVWRRERDRIVINPAYAECLRHYDTAPLPTGVRKPKHKAKAEVGVQIAQRWVLFALRDREFFSLEELNAELRRLTIELNAHPFKRMPGSRTERFDGQERHTLKPLPASAFEMADWKYGVRVGQDYHIEHAGCHYSVPYVLRDQRVDLRITSSTLEIMYRNRRVALHALSEARGAAVTLDEHRPIIHRRVLEGEPKSLLQWAQGAGEHTESMIRHHLEQRKDATNGLKAARRMRDLARVFGEERFEQVCAYALSLQITALRSVESILKQAPDQKTEISAGSPRPVHGNVRGGEYFGGAR